jgi:hypothetical protein
MFDTLQFVVVHRDGLAAVLLETFDGRRQTEVCRTSAGTPLPNFGISIYPHESLFQLSAR